MLHRPEELRADQATDNADDSSVSRVGWQTRAQQLAPEEPQADKGGNRHHDAEAGDLERADTEQYRIHLLSDLLRACAGLAARPAVDRHYPSATFPPRFAAELLREISDSETPFLRARLESALAAAE
jgi:hypothetical protein